MDNQNGSGSELPSTSDNPAAELEQMMAQAIAIGPKTREYIDLLIRNSRLKGPMLGACRGILRLARLRGYARMEAACARALLGNRYNLNVIKNILDKHLDEQLPIPPAPCSATREHENLRGDQFFK